MDRRQKQDLYSRIVAYVWLEDGQLFNRILVREGYAQITAIPPNVKYANLLRTLQAEAREQRRGLWKLESGGTYGEAVIQVEAN